MNSDENWLSQPPNHTAFRINRLKDFIGTKLLEEKLIKQSKVLHAVQLPRMFFLKPDCLILEQWSNEVTMKKSNVEVIVDASCAAAVLRGSHVFAPGVLGLPTRCQLGDIVDIYGDLEGKCKKGSKVKYDGNKLFVGIGYLMMLRKDLFNDGGQPRGIAIHNILPDSRLPVVNETVYPRGVLMLQNLPSIVCGWVVKAEPKDCILDMCAAPGNKTTHLAEMANNEALIIAIDKTLQKVKKIEETCEAHSVNCVKAYVYDSTKCCSCESTGLENGPPFPENTFDKILLDAPCSGLGQRPQLVSKLNPKTINSYKSIQRKLLWTLVHLSVRGFLFGSYQQLFYFTNLTKKVACRQSGQMKAAKLLKPGGKLVYSTCTVTIDENEGLVDWALQKLPELKLIPASPLLGGAGLQNCGLDDQQRAMVQRFGPHEDDIRSSESLYRDSIGFFIACFTK